MQRRTDDSRGNTFHKSILFLKQLEIFYIFKPQKCLAFLNNWNLYIFLFFNKSLKTKSLCSPKWGILEHVSKTFKITIKEKMMSLAGFHSFLLQAKKNFLVRERNVTWVFCLLILLLFLLPKYCDEIFFFNQFFELFCTSDLEKVLHLKSTNSILRSSDNQETIHVGLLD